MSEAEATELIEDKIKFKLFFAEKHYNKLVEYQQEETTDFLKTFVSRVRFEADLESLLAHLIGARDALLYRIRDRLGLCVKDNDVHLSKINKKLLWTRNRRLLSEMCSVSHDGFWLDHVNELRNTGIHRNIIPIRKSMTINSSSPMRITFTFEDSQTLEIIPYLNDSIQKMRVLIESIIDKEPILKK